MSQWKYLLSNLGIWDGSFTHLSAQGEWIDDVPSRVSLEGLNGNQQICQTVQMLSLDRQQVVSERVLNYSSLNRGVLVFETGAFSQGSMQYGPFSIFGAELGFVSGNRRLRLVQLFDKEANFSKITLIRECRQGTEAPDVNQLNAQSPSVEPLLGNWHGTATTQFADLSPPQIEETHRKVERLGDRLTETFKISGQGHTTNWYGDQASSKRLISQENPFPRQIVLLPGGVLSISPLSIPRHQPFALETSWLISAQQRQHMIRKYNSMGAWVSLTLTIEQKLPYPTGSVSDAY